MCWQGLRGQKKVHENLPIWDYMSWPMGTQKCLKQNKNMSDFKGPVEHGQNLLQNLAKWTGSAWVPLSLQKGQSK